MTYVYPVKSYRKAVVERRRLYIDYSCWLADDEMLVDMQVIVDPYTADAPLVVTSGYTDATNKKLTVFVSAGVANTNYIMSLVVRTDAGQVKRDSLGIVVTP
jgi:hypothetical protein